MYARTALIIALALLIPATADAAPKRKPKPAPIEDRGPDLPYPCFMVRYYASIYTEAQLEAMGRANGIVLSRKQKRQARECLMG